MRFLTFIIIIINIFLKPLIGQDLNNQKIKISIRQECYPGPNPIFTYKVSGKRFTIEKTKYIIRESIKVTDDIYTLKLNKTQEDSLKIILSKIDLTKFESSYTSAILDGIAWDFNLRSIYGTKKISLWNYYLPEFGSILDFLNRQLPKDKRFISFDLLGIRKNFKEK